MKTSFFNISTPLMKETLRRLWPISALAFMAYFIVGVFPILSMLSSYHRIHLQAELIDSILDNTYIFFSAIMVITPILASAAVFYYLKNKSAVIIMHSLPYTRRTLFLTNTVSGFILTILPIILTGILFLCIMKPTYVFDSSIGSARLFIDTYKSEAGYINVFTAARVFRWIWQSVLLAFTVYSLSILAAMITGNSPVHLFTAILLNVLGAGFGISILAYMTHFLEGFVLAEDAYSFLYVLSPISGILSHHGKLPLSLTLLYIALACGVLLLSCYCYEKRKLEKTGQSFVFQLVPSITCFTTTFFGMTICGFIFIGTWKNHEMLTYLSIIGGTIVTFIISRIIVKKSFLVFNKASIKNFAIYAVVVGIFIAVLAFDLTGFETRVPKTNSIASASILGFDMSDYSTMFNNEYFGKEKDDMTSPLRLTDKKMQRAVTQLHRQLLQEKRADMDDLDATTLSFDYQLKNGKEIKRMYWVHPESLQSNEVLKKIYESKEFKSYYSLNKLRLGKRYTFSMESPFCTDSINFKPSECKSLLSQINKDFMNSTYQDQYSKEKPYGSISISFNIKGNSYNSTADWISISIRKNDIHTLNWLKKHNYDDLLNISASDISSVTIRKSADMADDGNADFMYDDKEIEVKGKSRISKIMDESTDLSGNYECTFNFKRESPYYMRGNILYLDAKTAPDFVKEQFQ